MGGKESNGVYFDFGEGLGWVVAPVGQNIFEKEFSFSVRVSIHDLNTHPLTKKSPAH